MTTDVRDWAEARGYLISNLQAALLAEWKYAHDLTCAVTHGDSNTHCHWLPPAELKTVMPGWYLGFRARQLPAGEGFEPYSAMERSREWESACEDIALLQTEVAKMEARYVQAHADGENARRELHAFKTAREAAERALPRKVQQLDALHKAASDALSWWENYGLFNPNDSAFTETLDVLRGALAAVSPVPEEQQP